MTNAMNYVRNHLPEMRNIFVKKEGQRTCYMHYNREPRFYASIGFDQGIYYGNGKNDFESCNYTNFLNLGVVRLSRG